MGRLLASRVLIHVSPFSVVTGSAVSMAVTTGWMLRAGPGELSTAIAVFCVGLSMAAANPTLMGLAADAFPNSTGTVMGLVTTAGWAGLAVSSRLIGAIAGADESNLPRALLMFPLYSVLLIALSLAMRKRAPTSA